MPSVWKYNLGKTLNRGSFGKVVRAVNQETGLHYAVKIVNRDCVLPDLDAKQHHLATMKLLRHPNIVQLYDVLIDSKSVYLVHELMVGDLWDVVIQKKRLGEDQARGYYQQIIYGLSYLHANGLAHLHFIPENLLLDAQDKLKIADANFHSVLQGNKCMLHAACFDESCYYVAPEQLVGGGCDGRVADLWSSGVILYAMMAGYLPFDDQGQGNAILVCEKIERGEYRMSRKFSAASQDIIKSLLVVDPSARISIDAIQSHAFFRPGVDRDLLDSNVVSPSADQVQHAIVRLEVQLKPERRKELLSPHQDAPLQPSPVQESAATAFPPQGLQTAFEWCEHERNKTDPQELELKTPPRSLLVPRDPLAEGAPPSPAKTAPQAPFRKAKRERATERYRIGDTGRDEGSGQHALSSRLQTSAAGPDQGKAIPQGCNHDSPSGHDQPENGGAGKKTLPQGFTFDGALRTLPQGFSMDPHDDESDQGGFSTVPQGFRFPPEARKHVPVPDANGLQEGFAGSPFGTKMQPQRAHAHCQRRRTSGASNFSLSAITRAVSVSYSNGRSREMWRPDGAARPRRKVAPRGACRGAGSPPQASRQQVHRRRSLSCHPAPSNAPGVGDLSTSQSELQCHPGTPLATTDRRLSVGDSPLGLSIFSVGQLGRQSSAAHQAARQSSAFPPHFITDDAMLVPVLRVSGDSDKVMSSVFESHNTLTDTILGESAGYDNPIVRTGTVFLANQSYMSQIPGGGMHEAGHETMARQIPGMTSDRAQTAHTTCSSCGSDSRPECSKQMRESTSPVEPSFRFSNPRVATVSSEEERMGSCSTESSSRAHPGQHNRSCPRTPLSSCSGANAASSQAQDAVADLDASASSLAEACFARKGTRLAPKKWEYQSLLGTMPLRRVSGHDAGDGGHGRSSVLSDREGTSPVVPAALRSGDDSPGRYASGVLRHGTMPGAREGTANDRPRQSSTGSPIDITDNDQRRMNMSIASMSEYQWVRSGTRLIARHSQISYSGPRRNSGGTATSARLSLTPPFTFSAGSDSGASEGTHRREETKPSEFSLGRGRACADVQADMPPPRWRLGRCVGQGSFGKVFTALNQDNGQIMAVKILPYLPRRANELQREISMLKRFRHRHIVSYINSAREGDRFLIFTEFVSGGAISNLLREFGPLDEEVAMQYTTQIVLALAHLHSHDVVHRDLKCGNVLLHEAGLVKLADFGTAQLASEAALESTYGGGADAFDIDVAKRLSEIDRTLGARGVSMTMRTLRDKCEAERTSFLTEEQFDKFAQNVTHLWREVPGSVLDEFARNLRGPEGMSRIESRAHIHGLARAWFKESTSWGDLAGEPVSPMGLFVLKWYSMEGGDFDRLMGFPDGPPVYNDDPKQGGAPGNVQEFKEYTKCYRRDPMRNTAAFSFKSLGLAARVASGEQQPYEDVVVSLNVSAGKEMGIRFLDHDTLGIVADHPPKGTVAADNEIERFMRIGAINKTTPGSARQATALLAAAREAGRNVDLLVLPDQPVGKKEAKHMFRQSIKTFTYLSSVAEPLDARTLESSIQRLRDPGVTEERRASALQGLRRGELYRAVNFDYPGGEAVYAKWERLVEGDFIGFTAPSSTSFCREVCKDWMKEDGERVNLLVVMRGVRHGVPMWIFSQYKKEMEVLLGGLLGFRVAAKPREVPARDGWCGYLLVELAYVRSWLDTSPGVVAQVLSDAKEASATLRSDADADFLGTLAPTGSLSRRGWVGSPHWMAPEVVRGEPSGPPCDVWSLGATLLEMLTADLPFAHAGPRASGAGVLHYIATLDSVQLPPDVYRGPRAVGQKCRAFILQCLTLRQDLRPAASILLAHPFADPSRPVRHRLRSTASLRSIGSWVQERHTAGQRHASKVRAVEGRRRQMSGCGDGAESSRETTTATDHRRSDAGSTGQAFHAYTFGASAGQDSSTALDSRAGTNVTSSTDGASKDTFA